MTPKLAQNPCLTKVSKGFVDGISKLVIQLFGFRQKHICSC